MEYAKKIVEERCSKQLLDGRPMIVTEYATKEEVQILIDALESFDPDFSIDYRTKTQLRQMSFINDFISSPNHCRRTPFTFELRLCSVEGCSLCARINRSVRTPKVEVCGYNLQDEVLRWIDLPAPNPDDTNHYLSAADTRDFIDRNGVTFDALKSFIPDGKQKDQDQELKKAAKELDKNK